MNPVPEVIVMSVVVLSLVHLRSFLFFFRFGGRQSSRIVCTENKKGEEKRTERKKNGGLPTYRGASLLEVYWMTSDKNWGGLCCHMDNQTSDRVVF